MSANENQYTVRHLNSSGKLSFSKEVMEEWGIKQKDYLIILYYPTQDVVQIKKDNDRYVVDYETVFRYRVDLENRVLIPRRVRRKMGIQGKVPVVIFYNDATDTMILRKVDNSTIYLGSNENRELFTVNEPE